MKPLRLEKNEILKLAMQNFNLSHQSNDSVAPLFGNQCHDIEVLKRKTLFQALIDLFKKADPCQHRFISRI